jgi:ATP-dependent Lon protease
LHPGSDPEPHELNEYLAYAIEGRRRVKEQLNKKKPDDEFAAIDLGYYDPEGKLVVVHCLESKDALATLQPDKGASRSESSAPPSRVSMPQPSAEEIVDAFHAREPRERSYRIHYGSRGFSYESIFGEYLPGAEEIRVEDPYIRQNHQVLNFLRFCETAVRIGSPKRIVLTTKFEHDEERDEALPKLLTISDSLKENGVELEVKENPKLHDREVWLSNGWRIKIGRGFDFYQRPDDWFAIGASDLDLRPCLETNVDISRDRTK